MNLRSPLPDGVVSNTISASSGVGGGADGGVSSGSGGSVSSGSGGSVSSGSGGSGAGGVSSGGMSCTSISSGVGSGMYSSIFGVGAALLETRPVVIPKTLPANPPRINSFNLLLRSAGSLDWSRLCIVLSMIAP